MNNLGRLMEHHGPRRDKDSYNTSKVIPKRKAAPGRGQDRDDSRPCGACGGSGFKLGGTADEVECPECSGQGS